MCTVLWYWSKIKSCGTTQWRDDIIVETQKNTLASWKYKDDTRDFCFLLFLLIFFFFIDRCGCFLFCTWPRFEWIFFRRITLVWTLLLLWNEKQLFSWIEWYCFYFEIQRVLGFCIIVYRHCLQHKSN